MTEYIYEITTDSEGVDCYIKRGEIVRCKDCKYWRPAPMENGMSLCEVFGKFGTIKTLEIDFCSYGERKE